MPTNSHFFPSGFPRCIRQNRGNRGQEGRGGGLGTRCPPAAFLWPRWWPGAGLSAPAQAGHHSRPQHPRARGERRRRPAPRGHVMRARGLELRQRAATERSSAGRSWLVLLLLRPPASCLYCSPLLSACIPSRGAWRRRRRRCQQGSRRSRPRSIGASLLAAARTSPRQDGAAGLRARQRPERDVHGIQRHRGVLSLDLDHCRYRRGASPISSGCSLGCPRLRRQSPASALGKALRPLPSALRLLGALGSPQMRRRGPRGCALVNQMRLSRRTPPHPPSPQHSHLFSSANAGADLTRCYQCSQGTTLP